MITRSGSGNEHAQPPACFLMPAQSIAPQRGLLLNTTGLGRRPSNSGSRVRTILGFTIGNLLLAFLPGVTNQTPAIGKIQFKYRSATAHADNYDS